MEKMINSRLVWYLESHKLLSPFQFGFRKNRSTLDPLLRMSNQIQQGFSNQCQTIGVYFDLEKAYDTTWRYGIIKQLQKMGIKGKMIRFIYSFLSDRYIKVRVGNTLSSPFRLDEGVPQGSVLSVTCFAVAINGVMDVITNPVQASLFVDDLGIYCTAYDAQSACSYLQKAINSICEWAKSNGFKFSPSKTVAVRFTRSRRQEVVPHLKLDGSILPYADSVKFLGMILDSKLTWSKHIDDLKAKVKTSLSLLKVISGFSWGADKRTLLRLYDALCRSKIDYGCQIYSSACKSKLHELDVVHNMGLRICSGAFRTSPVESLYIDTHQLPLDLRREELGLRYLMRIKSNPGNPSNKVICQLDASKFRARSSIPFQVRLDTHVNIDSLKKQNVLAIAPSRIPPWLMPKAKLCQKTFQKKNTSDTAVKTLFLDHDEIHRNDYKIFTDGSKSNEGVGLAVVTEESCHALRLPHCASVYTAELSAVEKALEIVYNTNKKSFVIYSDSKSVLDSLNTFNPAHPLVQKVQEWLFRISCRRKSVCFCWVPAHVGIRGNEKADKEAKKACSNRNVSIDTVPHFDMKRPIHKYILKKWQDRWSSPSLANNKKLKAIRPQIEFWQSSFHQDRRTEIVLTRLRIGHSWLTHNFILDGGGAPECAHCDSLLTVEHILVHCTRFLAERRRHHLYGKSLCEILGDEIIVQNVTGFLKEIGLYEKI